MAADNFLITEDNDECDFPIDKKVTCIAKMSHFRRRFGQYLEKKKSTILHFYADIKRNVLSVCTNYSTLYS